MKLQVRVSECHVHEEYCTPISLISVMLSKKVIANMNVLVTQWCLFINIADDYSDQLQSTAAEDISHLKLFDIQTTENILPNGNESYLMLMSHLLSHYTQLLSHKTKPTNLIPLLLLEKMLLLEHNRCWNFPSKKVKSNVMLLSTF